jgi:hypothetical protein
VDVLAVGDVVIAQSGNGLALNFQCAVGVELMISTFTGRDVWFYLTETVGSIISHIAFVKEQTTVAMAAPNARVSKTFITNTQIITSGTYGGISQGFTGIQIK